MQQTRNARRSRAYKRKMIWQKLLGIGMLGLSALVIVIASHGRTPEEQDATPVLLFIPLGLYMLFSKNIG